MTGGLHGAMQTLTDCHVRTSAAILRAPLPPLPPAVPPMIRAIIQRCLAKEPPHRYQHAMEVRAALEAVQSDVSAPVAPAAAPIAPRHLARGTIGVWAVAILLVIVLIAAVVLWRQRDTRSPWQRVASEGRLTLALASEEPVFDPTLSPDGKMLCYGIEDSNGRVDLFVRRVAGGALVRVTNDDALRRRRGFLRTVNGLRSPGGNHPATFRLFGSLRHWAATPSEPSRKGLGQSGHQMESSWCTSDARRMARSTSSSGP